MITDEKISETSELDVLQNLLEKQIEMVRKSDYRDFDTIIEKTNSIMRRINHSKIDNLDELKRKQEKLKNLCRHLCLTVASEQAGVNERLKKIRRGKKTLGVYRGNL